MDAEQMELKPVDRHLRYPRWMTRAVKAFAVVIGSYALASYVILPRLWRHYEHHPVMEGAPKFTSTAEGFFGDPLNVGLVGTQAEVVTALVKAGWLPADRTTLRTGLGIAAGVLLGRPYPTAPVSNLYLWGRRQDLAFERPAYKSPRERHHVRFWLSPALNRDDRPMWLGAATFDRGVGLSHRTGQVTHHIAPDVDQERDTLMADLEHVEQLKTIYQVTGVGPTLAGRNGGGDWYYTDGELTVGILTVNNALTTQPSVLPNPAPVRAKDRIWSAVRRWVKR